MFRSSDGGLKQAFVSDENGCYDNRYGWRCFRPSYNNANWETARNACTTTPVVNGPGYKLPDADRYKLARRPNVVGQTHLSVPNADIYYWTGEEVPGNSSQAYAIKPGSGEKTAFIKSFELPYFCAAAVNPHDEFKCYTGNQFCL